MRYLVQKHDATNLHYDLRLETEPGVFKSFALPKGVPTFKGQARLAVPTPDHIEGEFPIEGVIPTGMYGAGTVQLHDRGEFSYKDPPTESKINFYVDSDRIKGGAFSLIRTGANWLLMKHAGEITNIPTDISVLSGRNLEEIKMAVPFDPQLAKLVAEVPQGEQYLFSLKLDGYRMLVNKDETGVHAFSRTGGASNDKFPEIIKELEQIPGTFQLDGEVHVNNSFADLHAGKGDPVYAIFDAPSHPGTLSERLEWIKENIPASSHIEILEHTTESWDPCVKNQEGLMIKNKDEHYAYGKRSWLKYKCTKEQEFIIVGFTAPRGSRKSLGALLLAYYDDGILKYAGKVGTGLNRETLADLYERLQAIPPGEALDPKIKATWVQPQLVAQIKYMEFTTDSRLRHPSFISLRDDKLPEDVVREIAELVISSEEVSEVANNLVDFARNLPVFELFK